MSVRFYNSYFPTRLTWYPKDFVFLFSLLNTEKEGWDSISRFNIASFLCLFQVRIWISNMVRGACLFCWYWWNCWPKRTSHTAASFRYRFPLNKGTCRMFFRNRNATFSVYMLKSYQNVQKYTVLVRLLHPYFVFLLMAPNLGMTSCAPNNIGTTVMPRCGVNWRRSGVTLRRSVLHS